MAAATRTFKGFRTSDRSFDNIRTDLTNARNEARRAGRTFNQSQTVERDEIDDRGTRLRATDGETGDSTFGNRRGLLDSQIRVHNPLTTSGSPGKSTRWYQRDGNTQIFRVFPGDSNTVGTREGAARSEAFVSDSDLTTVADDGFATTFSAEFQVVQHNDSKETMIYQSKGRDKDTSGTAELEEPAWGVALFAQPDGDIVIKRREDTRNPIQTGKKVGDKFDLKVVDTGNKYFVTIDGERKAEGSWNRGNTPTVSRWGAYVQGSAEGVLTGSDAQIVHVSGATVTRATAPDELQDQPSLQRGNSGRTA